MVDTCKAAYMQHVLGLPEICSGGFSGRKSPPPVLSRAPWNVRKQSGFISPTATVKHRSSRSNNAWKSGPQLVALESLQPKYVKTITRATSSVLTDVEEASGPTASELVSKLLELVMHLYTIDRRK